MAKEPNILEMSDDDIANMAAPPDMEIPEDDGTPDPDDSNDSNGDNEENGDDSSSLDQPDEDLTDEGNQGDSDDGDDDDTTNQENNADDDKPDANADDDDPDGDVDNDPADKNQPDLAAKDPHADDPKSQKPAKKDGKDDGKKDTEPKDQHDKKPQDRQDADKGVKPEQKDIDYKSAYEKIMAPFKANGKEIKLQSPDEAVKLMQMGANYTKKMQGLQPHLRMVKMLENNGLLDEAKLNFLIDINKKNPEAIKKLVKDAGIDPMDIDTEGETKYRPSNYSVSDKQMTFDAALDEVSSTDQGNEVLTQINKDWDMESKRVLVNDPNILHVMLEQKQAGVYDQISNEVDRQKLLGNFNGVPYITAYHQVGQALQQQGLLRTASPSGSERDSNDPNEQPGTRQETQNPQRQPVDRRPATRKPADDTNEKAKAASPVRTNPNKPGKSQDFNPLSMSDEEFEKAAGLGDRF